MSFSTPDQTQWTIASQNSPVIAGNALWTDPHSRAEIQVGPIEIRLDERTEVDFPRFDDDTLAIRVDQGVINVHLGLALVGNIQVITAAGRVDLSYPGSYHIDGGEPDPNGAPSRSQIAVLDGEAPRRITSKRDHTGRPKARSSAPIQVLCPWWKPLRRRSTPGRSAARDGK